MKKLHFFPLLIIIMLSLLSSGCTRTPEMPEDAAAALVAYWQSLPAAPGVEQHIIKTWPSAVDPAELTPWAPEMEVWCVIAEISAPADPEANGERLVWIVMRENEKAGWNAALLATMSVTWPYEACGADVPSG